MTFEQWWKAYEFVHAYIGASAAERIPSATSPLLERGAIVGICDVVNQCAPGPVWLAHTPDPTGVHCSGQHEPADWEKQQRWYMGYHAYVLDRVRELTAPIPCKGALGLWRPSAQVVRQLFIHGGTP